MTTLCLRRSALEAASYGAVELYKEGLTREVRRA